MRKVTVAAVMVCAVVGGIAVPAGGEPLKAAQVKKDAEAVASNAPEKPAAQAEETALQMRFDVVELKLSATEVERINKSNGVFDVGALSAAVIERGDARVKYSLGGPAVVNEKTKTLLMTSQRVPYVRGMQVSDKGVKTPIVEYENVGCTLSVVPRSLGEAGSSAIVASFGVELSELCVESTVEGGAETRAPIFLRRTQEFTARLSLGQDAYFWDLASLEQAREHAGGIFVHVYRLRLDAAPEKSVGRS
jgi:hypothetical protein